MSLDIVCLCRFVDNGNSLSMDLVCIYTYFVYGHNSSGHSLLMDAHVA